MKRLFYTPYTEDVERYVIKYILAQFEQQPEYKILYLTPTMFLYHRRMNRFWRELNILSRETGVNRTINLFDHIEIYEFDHWTKELVYKLAQENPVSRTECHVLIKRSISAVFPDRKEWLAESASLLDLFEQFDTDDISVDELAEISSYEDWQSIMSIYRRYLMDLKELCIESFSQCLRRLIKNGDILNTYDEVVFDGPFLFFRPIHEALMDRMERNGKPVSFIVPYHTFGEQRNPALEIIEKVYSSYVPLNKWTPIGKRFEAGSTDLHQLRTALFTNRTANHSGSFSFHSHSTVEEEIRQIVKTAKQLIQSGESSAKGMIIVTPDAMQLRPLVREISEQEQLEVEVPPRPFFGLTAGEFIRFIYESKWNDRKFEAPTYLDTSMFKRILVSKWFPFGESTIEAFQLLEDVFFAECVSLDEWFTKVKVLKKAKNELQDNELVFHPLHAVEKTVFDVWEQVLTEMQQLQQQLCIGQGSLYEHMERLVTQLRDISDRYGFAQTQFGSQFLERLERIVHQAKLQQRIILNAEEFRSSITQLLVESEEDNAIDDQEPQQARKNKILVTGPENVAFLEYKHVFVIQFTQERFPLLRQANWPLLDDLVWRYMAKTTKLQVNSSHEWEHLIASREKYYFYLTFFVPKVNMQISYSRTKAGEPQYPSHYLFDIGQTFNIHSFNSTDLLKQLENHGIATIHKVGGKQAGQVTNQAAYVSTLNKLITIHIDELGMYRLCPKRFYYSKKYPKYNVYSNPFQMGLYIAAEMAIRMLHSLIMEYDGQTFSEDLDTMSRTNQILFDQVPKYLELARQQLNPFFPVSADLWQTASHYARRTVLNVLKLAMNENEKKKILARGNAHLKFSLRWGQKIVEADLQVLETKYRIIGSREWNIRFGSDYKSFSNSHYTMFLNISSYGKEGDVEKEPPFSNWFYPLKRQFCNENEQEEVMEEIKKLVVGIHDRYFPKKIGEHCSYCPFVRNCHKSSD